MNNSKPNFNVRLSQTDGWMLSCTIDGIEVMGGKFDEYSDAVDEGWLWLNTNLRKVNSRADLLACLREKPLQRFLLCYEHGSPYYVVEYGDLFNSDMLEKEMLVAQVPLGSDAESLIKKTDEQYEEVCSWRSLPLVFGLYDGTFCTPEYLEAWMQANPDRSDSFPYKN